MGDSFERLYVAGRIRFYKHNWANITSDPAILSIVSGMKIEFDVNVVQNTPPVPVRMNEKESLAVDVEIKRLVSKGVIVASEHESHEFVSNIFTRPKKEGLRMILNLKELNETVAYHHFKMDTFSSAVKLITPGAYAASIDLKDAYYSVPIHPTHQKYLKFLWKGKLYKFTALPNGLSSGPRQFTKLLKPPLAALRLRGHNIVAYIDDTLIVGSSEKAVTEAVEDTITLLESLGFIINQEKSVFQPSRNIVFLGFQLDTISMRVTLPTKKIEEILYICSQCKRRNSVVIHELASLIGKLVATFPAVRHGPLHYRELEKEKIVALRRNRGNFKALATLGAKAKLDLDWWLSNVTDSFGLIQASDADLVIQTDASGLGWGAFDGVHKIGGRWNELESLQAAVNNINYLELWAAFLALRALCVDKEDITVKLQMDNTTAIAYVNNMGGVKSEELNALARDIWDFCIERNIWLLAVHLPGSQNIIADRLSRQFDEQLEWKLNPVVFERLCEKFGRPDIDLFASRLNAQLPRFVAWRPDPDAEAVDALSLPWRQFFFYAFPPFCLIGKCLQKVITDQADGILIVPVWPTQPWYSQIAHLLIQEPVLLPHSKKTLSNPVTGECHPMTKLHLMCCRLSGKVYGAGTTKYQQRLWRSFCHHGEVELGNSTAQHIRSGFAFVKGRTAIPFLRM